MHLWFLKLKCVAYDSEGREGGYGYGYGLNRSGNINTHICSATNHSPELHQSYGTSNRRALNHNIKNEGLLMGKK